MAAPRSPYARTESLLRRARHMPDFPDLAASRIGALMDAQRLYADHCDDEAVYPAIDTLLTTLCDLVEPAIEAAEKSELAENEAAEVRS